MNPDSQDEHIDNEFKKTIEWCWEDLQKFTRICYELEQSAKEIVGQVSKKGKDQTEKNCQNAVVYLGLTLNVFVENMNKILEYMKENQGDILDFEQD